MSHCQCALDKFQFLSILRKFSFKNFSLQKYPIQFCSHGPSINEFSENTCLLKTKINMSVSLSPFNVFLKCLHWTLLKWDLGSTASFCPVKPVKQAKCHGLATSGRAFPTLLRPNYDLQNVHKGLSHNEQHLGSAFFELIRKTVPRN